VNHFDKVQSLFRINDGPSKPNYGYFSCELPDDETNNMEQDCLAGGGIIYSFMETYRNNVNLRLYIKECLFAGL
jgi:hypothetical protein